MGNGIIAYLRLFPDHSDPGTRNIRQYNICHFFPFRIFFSGIPDFYLHFRFVQSDCIFPDPYQFLFGHISRTDMSFPFQKISGMKCLSPGAGAHIKYPVSRLYTGDHSRKHRTFILYGKMSFGKSRKSFHIFDMCKAEPLIQMRQLIYFDACLFQFFPYFFRRRIFRMYPDTDRFWPLKCCQHLLRTLFSILG